MKYFVTVVWKCNPCENVKEKATENDETKNPLEKKQVIDRKSTWYYIIRTYGVWFNWLHSGH